MSGNFIDSNVILYLASTDEAKATRAEEVITAGGVISVQVLNEIANVTRCKMNLSWAESREFLAHVLQLLPTVQPLTIATHTLGTRLCERYGLPVYDGMIVAAALEAGCDTLLSEDMHDGLLVDQRMRIVNPFRS